MSLPQLIVDGSSGRRKVLMVKFLTLIHIYFYCFEIMDKNLSLKPPLPPPVGKAVGTIQLIFPVSHSDLSSLYTIIELCEKDV